MSLAKPDAQDLSKKQKLAVGLGVIGLFILVLALFNIELPNSSLFLSLSLVLITIGTIIFANDAYLNKSKGIKNDGVWFKSISSTRYFRLANWNCIDIILHRTLLLRRSFGSWSQMEEKTLDLIALFDPFSQLLSGRPASQWFVYGTLYTIAILAFGYKFILKYRHNRYEQIQNDFGDVLSISICIFNSRIYVCHEF